MSHTSSGGGDDTCSQSLVDRRRLRLRPRVQRGPRQHLDVQRLPEACRRLASYRAQRARRRLGALGRDQRAVLSVRGRAARSLWRAARHHGGHRLLRARDGAARIDDRLGAGDLFDLRRARLRVVRSLAAGLCLRRVALVRPAARAGARRRALGRGARHGDHPVDRRLSRRRRRLALGLCRGGRRHAHPGRRARHPSGARARRRRARARCRISPRTRFLA